MRFFAVMATVVLLSVTVAHACGGMTTMQPPPFTSSAVPGHPGGPSTMTQPPGSTNPGNPNNPGTTTPGNSGNPSISHPGLPTNGNPDKFLTARMEEVIL